MRRYLRKYWLSAVLFIAIFFVGIFFGSLLPKPSNPPAAVITQVRDPNDLYPLIDPALYVETPESLSFPTYTPLYNALKNYVNTAEANNSATDISVYFKDLNSSDWVGINYTDQYDGASMLKVVTLIALLRASEAEPSLLSGKISVPATAVLSPINEQDFFPPENPVEDGQTYTIKYLMTQLITQSDNGANTLLHMYLGVGPLQEIYTDLHIPISNTSANLVSPQQYSHLFRTLYNASYLNQADSEEALELLSRTTFTQGLVAGVPSGTTVAHKFGERTLGSGTSAVHELHDCGIVYYPNHPYFLCVMTRGSDFPTLEGIIKDISSITWAQVSKLAKK
jgi:beta-lactamase class A